MNSIFAIAFNTFREAVRNRILYAILIFALILIGASGVLSELSIAAQDKIVKDLGFAAINFFGVAIAVFVGVSLVNNELEKKTIYSIVSKPISRWQFLLGKYFGLLLTIYVNVLIMTFCFLFMIHGYAAAGGEQGAGSVLIGSLGRSLLNLFLWNHYEPTRHIMTVILATCVSLAMITAFAVLFSSFSTPTLSMFLTVLTFVVGRMNADIQEFAVTLAQRAAETQTDLPLNYYFAQIAVRITPNLGVFHDVVEQAHYAEEVVIGPGHILYAVCYVAAVLAGAILIFNRRNFK